MGWKDRQPSNYQGGTFDTNKLPQDTFPAKLTAVSDGLYTWQEQIATDADYAGWEDLPGGRSGTDTRNPAYTGNDEVLDTTDEPVVFLTLSYYDEDLDWVYVVTSDPGVPETFSFSVSDGTTTCNDSVGELFNGVYQIVSCNNNGVTSVNTRPPTLRGTMAANLSFGGNATMNISEGGNTTVYDWLLSSGQTIANGTHVLAFLDQDGKYYVGGAQCPT